MEAGDRLCRPQSPSPGSVEILRFPRATIDAALTNQTVLTIADATMAFAGLDAATDIAFDDDGDFFFTDYLHASVGEIDGLEGPAPSLRAPLVDYGTSALTPSTVQFVAPGNPGGAFEPMQPPGGHLLVFATDYISIAELHEVRPRRPVLAGPSMTPIPAGTFPLDITDGPPNGIALLLLGPGGTLGESALTLGGFDQPLWLDGATMGAAISPPVSLDALGTATLLLHNPGFAVGADVTVQCVLLTTDATLGSTQPVPLQLGP